MKSDSSINSKVLGKLLKRYKSKKIRNEEILKAAKIKSTTWSDLNRLAKKLGLKVQS